VTRAIHWSRSVLFFVLLSVGFAVASGCSERDESEPCGNDYGTCGAFGKCGGGATCKAFRWRYGSADICARGCEDEQDCPRTGGRGGRCVDVNLTGEFQCFSDCLAEEECPPSWVCQPIRSASGVSGICLP